MVVELPGAGRVTLATLDELREACRAEAVNAASVRAQAAELEARVEDLLADAGALLVPRRAWWTPPPSLLGRLAEAGLLVRVIAVLDRRWNSRAGGWLRALAATRLRRSLVAVGAASAGPGAGVPDVGPLVVLAAEALARAGGLGEAAAAALARLRGLEAEISRREEAERLLGFDSVALAAHVQVYGLPVVQPPLALARDEVAHLAVEAALVLPAPPRSRAPGTEVPTAYTGIHQWVGGLHRGPAPSTAAGRPEMGLLAVTNGRLAFAGTGGEVAVPLGAILELDVYDDGIAVSSLGQERQLFLVAVPGRVAMYLNWAICRYV